MCNRPFLLKDSTSVIHSSMNGLIFHFFCHSFPERNWNMWIPGFGSEDLRHHKRSALNEAHKSRLALIRKTLKKY